jgi:hypothetical protein
MTESQTSSRQIGALKKVARLLGVDTEVVVE